MNIIAAKRIDKFTYGLMYPAFFGNIVYDLILSKTDFANGELWSYTFPVALMIICYYAIDYIHLFADMDEAVKSDVKNKSTAYILCDIATPIQFFVGFVFLKKGMYDCTMGFIGTVPIIISIYKLRNKDNRPRNGWPFFAYAVVCSLITVWYYLSVGLTAAKSQQVSFILWYLIFALGVYSIYVFFFYRRFGFGKDVKFVEDGNKL